MPRIGRMDIAAADVVTAIEAEPRRVFTLATLSQVLMLQRDNWRSAMAPTVKDFVRFLERKGLKQVVIEFQRPDIKPITRYVWKEASPS